MRSTAGQFIGAFIPSVRPAGPGQFAACNGLRGVGAIIIAAAHLGVLLRLDMFRHIDVAVVFVDLFFVFSGLVLTHAYGARLAEGASRREFLLRRIGRLWPMQIATLGFLVAWECVKWGVFQSGVQLNTIPFDPNGLNPSAAILPNLLLLNAMGLTNHETWNFPSWTIGAEAAAYVVFALVFSLFYRARIVVSLVIIALSLLILSQLAPQGMLSTSDFGVWRCLAGFFTGVLVHESLRWDVPVSRRAATALECLVLIETAAFAFLASRSAWEFAVPLNFILLVWVMCKEQGALSQALFGRGFQVLAEWSYSIYMTHAIVLIFLVSGLRLFGRLTNSSLLSQEMTTRAHFVYQSDVSERLINLPTATSVAILVAYLCVVVVVSAFTYRFIETPARRWFNAVAHAMAKRHTSRRDEGAAAILQTGG